MPTNGEQMSGGANVGGSKCRGEQMSGGANVMEPQQDDQMYGSKFQFLSSPTSTFRIQSEALIYCDQHPKTHTPNITIKFPP